MPRGEKKGGVPVKVYVLTDMEGISGIVHVLQVQRGTAVYEEGRLLLAGDVNAAIAGAFDAGATEVVVSDGHGGSGHFPLEKMDARAVYERPATGRNLLPCLDRSFEALLVVGQHAMSGTPAAFLEHTQSPEGWHRYSIDGVEYGELGQAAFYAGAMGVPTVFICGDLAAVKEAQAQLPGIVGVSVKEGITADWCRSLAPSQAHRLIQAGAAEAVRRRKSIPVRALKFPVTVRVEFNRCSGADQFEGKPAYRRLDGFTIEWQADSERHLLPY